MRHGSWKLSKEPGYRYQEDLVQQQEQVRLGVEQSSELADVYSGITEHLQIAEDGFRPHLTLGLARKDLPLKEVKNLPLPTVGAAAPALSLQQELTATDFRVLVRK
ncbi:hypothetical protein [Streptomyces sp. NPDC001594]|uniref:hypothetical protein n=1 Tax=Streptomyces sp. NPDC001594 TaxID=3364590 RepID=UPI00369DFB79